MKSPQSVEVKIIGSREIINDLQEALRTETQDVEILSTAPEQDPTYLGFNFLDPHNLVVFVQTSYYIASLSTILYSQIKSRQSRVVICGLTTNVEIVYKKGLTEEEVKNILKKLLE